jgi:hypothetical protein
MGTALLHVKNDPERALSAFRDGLRSDPANIAIYLGIDQTLSLLNRPARERVEALEKYPQMDAAPPALIYELILNLAEARDFDRATKLFHNRFFPREEGGTNVRQVWIEVQLLRILASAKQGHCGEALAGAEHLGSEVPELAFTRDGLEPILQSARTSYLLGTVFASCGKAAEAKAKFALASAATAPDQIKWAWLAARWNRRKIEPIPAATRVGGNTRPHLWQRNSPDLQRRTSDFARRCSCRTACWLITSRGWRSPNLRSDHLDL